MKLSRTLIFLALLSALGTAHAADTATKQTTPQAKASKPSARGPGTQTEDELYIGSKAKPAATAPKATQTRKPRPASTGDEDLEDLEVERAKNTQARSK
jgi:hypothetical protein